MKSCENAEKTLGDAIRILVSGDEQIKRGKSILEVALRERAMQSEMWPTDTMMKADAQATEGTAEGHMGGDDDYEFDAGATTAVRGGKSVTTVVLLVVVPIAVPASAMVALFMLRNQRQPSKSAADD
ncbi:hypothetical protein ERJ75_000081500 [Trypanosoma vivax]|nr:hypothetical protein ERJ75_000081500 [Trypanosoma vivax]